HDAKVARERAGFRQVVGAGTRAGAGNEAAIGLEAVNIIESTDVAELVVVQVVVAHAAGQRHAIVPQLNGTDGLGIIDILVLDRREAGLNPVVGEAGSRRRQRARATEFQTVL